MVESPEAVAREASTLRVQCTASTFYGPAFARWLSEQAGEPIQYEKVEPGDEQNLPSREQRELDALPSGLDPEG